MDEELNEHDLEERLYAMLHHVDATQNNVTENDSNKFDVPNFVENGPRSTMRRYWRAGPDTNPYQKINPPKDLAPAPATKPTMTQDTTRPKEEKRASPRPPIPVDLSVFQSPIPKNVKKTIEFLDHEDENPVVLESSDEDEVVEVALPPKPTITIESSDEDDLHIVKTNSPTKTDSKSNSEHKQSSGERAVSSSPVPSVVSSVSDEFIRSDCIALNISSRHPDKHSFDFSLHGSDLLIQNTPSKKKKRKKNKEAATSTPMKTPDALMKSGNNTDGCFATPKSKAKNKKQKSKSFSEKLVLNVDVFDSDSNHCIADMNKDKNPYIVTKKSLPSVDVYESDSNQSEVVKEINTDQSKKQLRNEPYNSDTSNSDDKTEGISSKKNNTPVNSSVETVDLTHNDKFITIDKTGINESILMANVTGFTELDVEESRPLLYKKDISKYVSSKVPSILYEDLDFYNLKGMEKVCKKRRYSQKSLRVEMEKFYNESWGGEDFNHREIQKNMSRDKSLWAIDPKDRMPSLAQRKTKCNYCNRAGHRDDTCRQKPPVCYMCGNAGHFEPRCPTKICVNCGAPNFMYSTMCRNCSSWRSLSCAECGQAGHPASHCPDLWRRYHNTIDTNIQLEASVGTKKHFQQYCSGCSRRGHLVHVCRSTIPFSGLTINSPYVRFYRPLYRRDDNQNQRSKSFFEDNAITAVSPRLDRNKRHSKSPTLHESHKNKKRHVSLDGVERQAKSPVAQKIPISKDTAETPKNKIKSVDSTPVTSEATPDFISINSNRDNEGHMIQDNEVSDTSDVVTSSRIYVTNDIVNKLKTKPGEDWLKTTTFKLNVVIASADVNSFLTIKGKLADQEAFQTELRKWSQNDEDKLKPNNDETPSDESKSPSGLQNVPKNRNNLLRQLSKALDMLKEDLGDPQALYKELTYSQNRHEKLTKQKVISPKTLTNSRTHIKDMQKKLNIILLGQAGLADGTAHINELQSFKEKLMSSRQKTISSTLRKEIGDHFHSVFSSSARDDYMDLMQKYYLSKTTAKAAKKRRRRPVKSNIAKLSKADSIPSKEMAKIDTSNQCSNNEILLRDLITSLTKLTSLRNSGKFPKKTNVINQMRRRVHPFIIILKKKQQLSSKMLKKIRKAQEMSRLFLATL